ncbi:LysR family transcriptional regulator [Clostridium sp. AF15-17LB]|nr:LysR family transcriptional regulator [Clostridium sp. AF15-17LB]
MRLEYIRSFISVVNCKSFSLAARQIFLSQPTISTHIKQLESELGVQLLVRSTKDVILSEAGVIFYPFAVRLLETENEALSQIHKTEMVVKGTVSIATSSVPGNYILPQFLACSRKAYPDINYRISEGDSAQVLQSILHFETDIGIGSIKSANEKCMCLPLVKDQIVLAAPNTEEYRNMKGNFPLERLKQETYVLREPGSGTRLATESIEQALDLHAKPLKVALQAESSELVKRGVEQGIGVAFISSLAVKESVEQGKVLKFEFPDIDTSRQLYLLYHKDRVMTVPVTTTIKILRQYCQSI